MYTLYTHISPSLVHNDLKFSIFLHTISRIEVAEHKEVNLEFKWAGALRKSGQNITSKELKESILQDWIETD